MMMETFHISVVLSSAVDKINNYQNCCEQVWKNTPAQGQTLDTPRKLALAS
jgi:hypothetical protein